MRHPTTPAQLDEAFAHAPVLAALTAELRASLARESEVVELRAHQLLWRQGGPARALGLILRGRVALERLQGDRRVLVDVAGANEVLGEVAFSLERTYRFDVRCLRSARVALVPTAPLRKALERDPALAVALAGDLAQQLLNLTRRVEALSAGSVRQRLAQVLLTLTERFGVPFPGGTLMPARVRREDLAALAATTVESASRQISAWTKEGVLLPQPVGFLVRDVRALAELSPTLHQLRSARAPRKRA